MKITTTSIFLNFFFLAFFLSCSETNEATTTKFEIPKRNHDLGYIPYNAKVDALDYKVCDTSEIHSGRNRIKYQGGYSKLEADVKSNFKSKNAYKSFTGFIVVRFMVNCNGISGRYRAQSMNPDFSPTKAPADLLDHCITLMKDLDTWTKSNSEDPKMEYSKFINLKINNGKIEHVLL